jgi:hypothetical protein
MKHSFSLHNSKIDIFEFLNFNMWSLIYSLNKDIIQSYRCIEQTPTELEYIYVFQPMAMLPSFYIHNRIIKQNNEFIAKSIHNEHDNEYQQCIQLITSHEIIQFHGNPNNVTVTVNVTLQMDILPSILEPTIMTIFKKIYARLSEFITNIK